MFPADGIAGVPRRPRTGVRKRGGDCWNEVVKRAKLAVNGNPGPTPRRQRHRQAAAAEQETEQEVAEALFNLASGGVGSSYQADQASDHVKNEEPLPRNRSGSHSGRGQGRGSGDRRKQPRELEDARQWAANDATTARTHIATPKAVKASTSSAAVGPSVPLPALPASAGANIGLGMGLGAFAGTFPNGLNGAYYTPSTANAAAAAHAAAAAQAQGTLWPPSFPGHGREDAGEPSTSGQEVLMPPQRRNWKRCASHVYIAHFIEYQIHKDRLEKQKRQTLRALGAEAAASPDLLQANGAAAATPPDAAGRSPPAAVAISAATQPLPLPLLNGAQVGNGAYSFAQPASAPLAAGNLGRPGQGMPAQQNGFPPQYAQQLQNHLLLQQSGAFPFLPPGMQHLGGQFLGGANGGLTPQQAAAVAASFPFPASAHMLGLAGFGNLGQQINGANGLNPGFGPRKIDIKDGLSGDVAALKRAAAASGMKPEDMLKLGLPQLTTPEAAARLHALGVPSAMLNGRTLPNGGVPPAMTMAGFHEQLLAAAAQQRSESQGVPLMH